ncbi:MAG: UDPGP type 1 family protein, partial [Planctomycetaceae bacterium]|nr:UDPGP type 1 family protein [Planctomycetaceae bacterium]
ANEIRQLDLDLVRELIALRDAPHEAGQQSRAAAAESPQDLVRVPQTEAEQSRLIEAGTLGEALLRQGKVAAVLVAGGQGSRLGFDAPKGVFPIGPVSERTLFQVLCEQIAERSNLAGAAIPYLIMTSAATHAETVEFFQQQDFFGLGEENVFFFQQASLPAIDDASPRILMSSKHSLALSPDGHGGMLRALRQSGLLQQMANRGIEHFYYHQVDNPTAIVCDPVFLGLHASSNSEMSTKVVAKVSPEERMGVVVTIDGQTQIIEYSDLTPEESRRQDASGDLIFWAGNTAIHAFRLDFLQRLTATTISLPFHIAHKPVAHVGTDGSVVPAVPSQPNANKFEQFIFDALPQANVALVQEADRAREFNPVKNAEGNDSPATSRAALNRIAREWAEAAGCEVAESVQLEVSPLFALDAEKFAQRVPAGTRFTEDQILS